MSPSPYEVLKERGNSLKEGLVPLLNAPLQRISSPAETVGEIIRGGEAPSILYFY